MRLYNKDKNAILVFLNTSIAFLLKLRLSELKVLFNLL